MRLEYYEAIIEKLTKDFSLNASREHQFVTEFSEDVIPVFKLILSEGESSEDGVMIVSFHLEMRPPEAVQWFLRLRSLDPNLHITASYIKDIDGNSYVGEDAEILRTYIIEQEIVTAWIASNKDIEEISNQIPVPKSSPTKTYNTYKQALAEFQKMQKKKGDVSH